MTCLSGSGANAGYRQVDRLRLRGVPENGTCLVYNPAGPRLCVVNSSAWLVLSLCDGASQAEIARRFHAQIEPLLDLAGALTQVSQAIDELVALQLVRIEGGGDDVAPPS